MLEVHDLKAGYGPVEVLHGLSLNVDTGEIVAVLGANGVRAPHRLVIVLAIFAAELSSQNRRERPKGREARLSWTARFMRRSSTPRCRPRAGGYAGGREQSGAGAGVGRRGARVHAAGPRRAVVGRGRE